MQNPKASMPFSPGYEEDKFLQSLGITKEDIEPKASNCTEVIYIYNYKCLSDIEISYSVINSIILIFFADLRVAYPNEEE